MSWRRRRLVHLDCFRRRIKKKKMELTRPSTGMKIAIRAMLWMRTRSMTNTCRSSKIPRRRSKRKQICKWYRTNPLAHSNRCCKVHFHVLVSKTSLATLNIKSKWTLAAWPQHVIAWPWPGTAKASQATASLFQRALIRWRCPCSILGWARLRKICWMRTN